MHSSGLTDTSRLLGVVESNDRLGTMRLLRVRAPGWSQARPGQFVLLQAEDSRCFLGRAVSVCDQSGEDVWLLIAPVGKGTLELCSLSAGQRVWVLGPLGNGFDVQALVAGAKRVLLVGGGAGVAPFPLLVSELAKHIDAARRDAGVETPSVSVLAGFRDSEQALSCRPVVESVSRAEATAVSCRYEEAVEDGSAGQAERVSDLLARNLESGDHLAVCGPEAMAKAVWDVCCRVPGVEVWFSLETGMACGVGSCHGCVVPLADGSYARVCKEGPVFTGEEVFGG